MNWYDWYKKAWLNYAQFSGRAQRAEYWWFTGVNFAIAAILRIITVSLIMAGREPMIGTTSQGMMVLGFIVSLVLLVFALAMLIPTISVTVRRLHDIGKSGWFYLLILIPFVGALVIFIMTLLDSEPSKNAYGANPKEESRRAQWA